MVVVESALRRQIMDALERRTALSGGFLTRDELSDFPIGDGSRRRLIDRARGIWNPRDLVATLSVVSSPGSRHGYDDREVLGGLFHYSYRAGSPQGDNTKLRRAWELELPIILLRKIADGVYVPIFPVYVIEDDTVAREFVLALVEGLRFLPDPLNPTDAERRYAERVVKQRLHQPEFRGRVIRAYDVRCAVCNLEVGQLLDAAHIVSDGDELGQPVVQNGLSMCKIHHAAFDQHLLGITPDYEVRLNHELLDIIDGPMLRHGLQEMHGRQLTLPRRRDDHPDPERIDLRYMDFMNVDIGTTVYVQPQRDG